jgi:hypothetical protein
MIEFPRMRVRPKAYAFRTGPHYPNGPHLNSFVFQGFDTNGHWATLDERHNPYKFQQHYSSRICFVDTDCYFSAFRFKVVNGGSFAFSAFDIHGTIELRQELPLAIDVTDKLEDENGDFDPWGDIPDFE